MNFLTIQLQTSDSENAGFSLLETIVAIAILLITVSGIMNVIYEGATASQLQTERVTATYLAAEAVEYIRADRDSHWLDADSDRSFNTWKSDILSGDKCDGPCRIDARSDDAINSCNEQCPYLEYDSEENLYGYGYGSDSRYRRTVNITDAGSGEVIVTATVTWEQAGGDTASVEVSESILDYRDN